MEFWRWVHVQSPEPNPYLLFGDKGSQKIGSSQDPNPDFRFPQDTGTYTVHLVVKSQEGCEDDTIGYIKVFGEFGLYVSNSFTPNGDGINDLFFPMGVGIRESDYLLLIFDRWGEMIFKSEKPGEGWNGSVKVKQIVAANGVYVWKLEAIDMMGKPEMHRLIGHVTLVN